MNKAISKISNCLALSLLVPVLSLAQTTRESKLTGAVYDAFGAVVQGASVKATGIDRKVVETKTNNEGAYILTLNFNEYDPDLEGKFKEAKYDIVYSSPGFKDSTIKGFVFVPSFKGSMNLDIALEIMDIEPCGPAGACPFGNETEIPFDASPVTDKIVLPPVVEATKPVKTSSIKKTKDN